MATYTEPESRRALRNTRRILIKAGTSVVANDDGRPSLTRLGAICEQIAEIHRSGVQVIMVSSGATGMGKRLMRQHGRMNMSISEMASIGDGLDKLEMACAAAGQFEMMNLYNSLFSQMDVSAAQVLLTEGDFRSEDHLNNLHYSIERLLSVGIIPIINENDAVSANRGYTQGDLFSDNDSLAALCARSFACDLCILLTDVDGVFDRPPKEKGAKLLPFYSQNQSVGIGEKSKHGRGGMDSKINAAQFAVSPGSQTRACVVISGADLNAIRSVTSKEYDPTLSKGPKGTFAESVSAEAHRMATAARDQARKLQGLSHSERKTILYAVADELQAEKVALLAANKLDLEIAERDGTEFPLVSRLKLTEAKLATLSAGIRQIADQPDPLGVVKAKRELADGLVLSQITVPIGVLMIIFESRPDSMPQISALALASGNGLLLKGGKEAAHSNEAIHKVIGNAVEKGSGGKITRDIIALVTSRGQVADMLKLDDVVDLVIPRGGNTLVSFIKANTRIPVLGHADGVCHVYVDKSANDTAAVCKLVVDAKTDYPSACNAMETLLLHRDTLQATAVGNIAMSALMSLRAAGVKCLGGPKAMKTGLCDIPAQEMKCEYGDLTCMVEIVEDMDEAIDWIHKYGSGHTESIVCADDSDAGEEFLKRVDAACVFKNASTRFADGYRFGLGAEVGISTGRIHARGPVGVEGLLTVKWQLRSTGVNCVQEYGGGDPQKVYTHKELI
ncbi:gamma-glutamyl phosphate reductase [Thalassiosira pseudonana CCMP1335]|uniref:Delta-1-pyrroline-5-carboxylate synthase n=1 Tax=Thalassiosira pseudonana TaxID=35128 RepID=B8C5V7_THAPS|nr:gamma-glutamyl phosphate reductase [Thalassiosira pseudonana CCMP1335]EED91187.1 gamma-glutamyl phosphate reductase [Thalassiosira pseudonana CCMP1335]